MPEVKDTGKVWIRGKSQPTFAIRVDDKIFVPGREENQSVTWWIDEDVLCVDLCSPGVRIARRFDLNIPPVTPATLFSGFDKTQHGDVKVVVFQEAEEFIRREAGIESMDKAAFWENAVFKKQ